MSKERSFLLFRGLLGGLFAGLALSQLGVLFMPLAIALLWSITRSIFASFLWGFVAILVSHQWLLALHPLNWIGVPAPLSLPIAISIWLFCAAFAGLLVGLWALVGNTFLLVRFRNGSALGRLCCGCFLSSLWGLSEVVLAKSPFFWIGVGSSLLPGDIALAGWAQWIGAGGLASLQLLIGFWVWQTFLAFRSGGGGKKLLLIGSFLLIFFHVLGASFLVNQSSFKRVPVAIWQSNIPVRQKFSQEQQIQLTKSVQIALEKAGSLSASWLVAPEGTLSAKQNLISPAPIPFLTGGFRWVRGAQRSSLLVIDEGNKSFSSSIDKHRLVPLGEQVPKIPGFAMQGLSAVGGLEPGASSRLLLWSGPPVAVAICYELSDGNAMAKAVKGGADWILVLANLDPYPISLQRQFLVLSQLRSIETSRDLITVANTGPSSLVIASGKVQKEMTPFKESVDLVNLNLRNNKTFYTRWREAPLTLVLLISFLGLTLLSKKN